MWSLFTAPSSDHGTAGRSRVPERDLPARSHDRDPARPGGSFRDAGIDIKARSENQTPRIAAVLDNPTLWQHRFWEHRIRDEADFNRHIHYIHWNPVKHGSVAPVSHRPYSRFHRYVKQRWLPANWGSNIESLNGADFSE
ncbi:MAG: transposase [Gammaproteobacteria bacterium]